MSEIATPPQPSLLSQPPPIQAGADGTDDDATNGVGRTPKGVGQTAMEAHGALKSDVADINATGIEGEPALHQRFFFSLLFFSEMLSLCLLLIGRNTSLLSAGSADGLVVVCATDQLCGRSVLLHFRFKK